MKIVIVRHGISEFNLKERGENPYFCGAYNTPLADSGKEMAKKLQNNENVQSMEKVYSSDLDRALETAKLAKPNAEIVVDKNLRERSLGIFENHSEKYIHQNYPDYFENGRPVFRKDFIKKAPGGENYTDVCNRCKKFLDSVDLISNQTIGIFSHYHFIVCLLYTLMNLSKEQIFNLKIKNCDPIVLQGNEIGKFKCLSHDIEKMV